VGCGGIVMGLMAYMQSQVLTDPECVDPTKEAKRKKQKTKMSIGLFTLSFLLIFIFSLLA
jgi:Mn2+/Fe2+ NRAMP family transporter